MQKLIKKKKGKKKITLLYSWNKYIIYIYIYINYINFWMPPKPKPKPKRN
jgi:hypothetical protein